MDIRQNIAYKEQALANNALSSRDPAIVGSALRHIQMATQNGTIPAYVGIPLVGPLAQHFKQLQAAQAMPAPQMPGAAGPQPTIAEQAMAEAQGIEQAQSNLPAQGFAPGGIIEAEFGYDPKDNDNGYAPGGIVAFAGKQGSLVDDDDDTEDEYDYEDRLRAAEMANFDDQVAQGLDINDYLSATAAAPAAPVSSESGISAINLTPAAAKGFGLNAAAPSGTGIRQEAQAPRGVNSIIDSAASKHNLPPELLQRIAAVESGGRADAANKLSSAKGLFQFTDRTWKGMGGKEGEQFNPEINADLGGKLTRQNAEALKKAFGRDPTFSEVYAAHYFGLTDAKKLLKADPRTPVADIFTADVMKSNPNLKGQTAGSLLASLNKKTGEGVVALAKGGIAQLPTKHYVLGDLVMGDFGEAISADPRVAAELDEFGRPVKDVLREKPLSKEGAEALEKLKSNAAKQAAANAPKAPKAPPSTPAERIAQRLKSMPRPSVRSAGIPALVGYGGYKASDYATNIASNPAFQDLYQSDPGSDAAIAAQIQAGVDKEKPIAKWIPDWLLPADLKERRDIETGVKKPEAATPAAPAPEPDLPPAAVQDPNNPLNYVETKDPFEGNPLLKDAYEWFKTKKEGLASDREQDKWMSVLAAGLGMMGGTSPFAGANIGQGALQGIQAQLASNKLRAREEQHLGDFASRLGTAHEVALGRKSARAEKLAGEYEKLVSKVEANRVARRNELLKTPEFFNVGMMKDTIAKRIAEAEAKGKKPDAKDVAEYNRLDTKLKDLDAKIAKELRIPTRQEFGLSGFGLSGAPVGQQLTFNEFMYGTK